MRTDRKCTSLVHLTLLVILTLVPAVAANAQIVTMLGDITGIVNGTPVNFDVEITLDISTGEETAEVRNMPPSLGAVLRPVTAMVTVGGPTGGLPLDGAVSLLQLSGGNFVNSATVFWPDLPDSIEIIHTVSTAGPDTLVFTCTMNGTAPQISLNDAVEIDDFSEVLRRGGNVGGAESILSGPGQRPYRVGGVPFPPCPPTCPGGGGTGKGSVTTYQGPPLPFDTIRSAFDLTTTYDPATEIMSVHLFNTLRPVPVPQHFNGILHTALGSSQLNPSPTGDRLVVSNIGSSGKDGVSMDLGPGGQGAEWEWIPLPPQAEGLTLSATGTLNGTTDTFLGSTSMIVNVDSFFDIAYNFSPLGSPTARVEFYANGQHVRTVEGATGVVATAPVLAHDCGKGGERIPRPLPLPYPYPPFPFPFPPLPWEPIPCFIWGWDSIQPLQLADGTTVDADQIRILTEVQGLSLDSLQNITLQGHAAPDSFFDIFLDAGECRYRSLHRGLGQAHMTSDANGHLVISNIGSSGLDGVSVDLGDTEIGRGFEWLPLPPMPPGSFLETQAFGSQAGTTDQFLGSLRVTNSGSDLQMVPDYSPLGSSLVQLQFFSNGQLVDIVSNVPMGQPIVAQSTVTPNGCGKVYPDPTVLCFYWEWPTPIPWQVPGVPGPIVADYVNVLAQNATTPFDAIQRLSVVGDPPDDLCYVLETNALHGAPGFWDQAYSSGDANLQPETSAHGGGLTVSNIGSSGLDGVRFFLPPATDTFATFFAPLGSFNDYPDGRMVIGATGRLQGDTENRFLGDVTLQANLNPGCIDISTNYGSLGATGVRFQAYNDGVLVADQSLPDGVPILRIPEWPDACGKEPVPLPFPWPLCIWIDPGTDIPIELLGAGGAKRGTVIADTFRLLAENPSGALESIRSWDLTLANIPLLIVGAAGTGIQVTAAPEETPSRTELYRAAPNPFNPRTNISFDLSRTGKVTLDIYDLAGRHVATLHNGVLQPGRQSFSWNGTDANGKSVASGVYAIRLDSPDGSFSQKVTLVK